MIKQHVLNDWSG